MSADYPAGVRMSDTTKMVLVSTELLGQSVNGTEQEQGRARNQLRAMIENPDAGSTMGVGDGSGRLFVHGDYDSIKAMQAIVLERDQMQRGQAEAAAAINTLQGMGYTYNGAELWKPPLGKAPDFDLLDSMRALLADHQTCLASCRYLIQRNMPSNSWLHHIDRHIAAVKAALAGAVSGQPEFIDYITKPGESLGGIAFRQLGCETRWVEILDINAGQFPDDFEHIRPHSYFRPGTCLKLPRSSAVMVTLVTTPGLPDQQDDRPAGCCCPPKGHNGLWGAGPCPVHQGLRRVRQKDCQQPQAHPARCGCEQEKP